HPRDCTFIPQHSCDPLLEAGNDIDVSATYMIEAPAFICILIPGPKGVPAILFHFIYSSTGISGYMLFNEGRTGATIFLNFLLIAKLFISLTILSLKPVLLNSG